MQLWKKFYLEITDFQLCIVLNKDNYSFSLFVFLFFLLALAQKKKKNHSKTNQ